MIHPMRAVIWMMAFGACVVSLIAQSFTPQSADALVNNAVHQAAHEGKGVIVVFGASWCAPCRALDAFFQAADVHNAIAHNYVTQHLTILEHDDKAALNTPGGEAMFNTVGGDGIPLIAFFDGSGRMRGIWNDGLPSGSNRAEFLRLFTENRPSPHSADLAAFLTDLKHALGVYSVSGRVLDERGQPSSGAHVSVISGAYKSTGQWAPIWGPHTKTGQGGSYAFDGLTAGEYEVIADSDTGSATVSLLVRPREDRSEVDIQLAPIRSTEVNGVALRSNGQPLAHEVVTLANLDRPAVSYSSWTSSDGAFSFAGVRPGRYNAAFKVSSPTPSGTLVEAALEPFPIGGAPSRSLKLIARKAGSLSGIVTFDGGQMTTKQLSEVRVVAVAPEPEPGAPSGNVDAAISGDHHFTIRGLFGPRVLRVSGLPAGWRLDSARINGHDAAESPIDFTGLAPIDGARLILSTSPSRQQ